jgi:hypothetical protein
MSEIGVSVSKDAGQEIWCGQLRRNQNLPGSRIEPNERDTLREKLLARAEEQDLEGAVVKAFPATAPMLMALASSAPAQTCGAVPNNLTNRMTADANQVTGNFNSILNSANGSLAPLYDHYSAVMSGLERRRR